MEKYDQEAVYVQADIKQAIAKQKKEQDELNRKYAANTECIIQHINELLARNTTQAWIELYNYYAENHLVQEYSMNEEIAYTGIALQIFAEEMEEEPENIHYVLSDIEDVQQLIMIMNELRFLLFHIEHDVEKNSAEQKLIQYVSGGVVSRTCIICMVTFCAVDVEGMQKYIRDLIEL